MNNAKQIEKTKNMISKKVEFLCGSYVYKFNPYWNDKNDNANYIIDLNFTVSADTKEMCIEESCKRLKELINNINIFLESGELNEKNKHLRPYRF